MKKSKPKKLDRLRRVRRSHPAGAIAPVDFLARATTDTKGKLEFTGAALLKENWRSKPPRSRRSDKRAPAASVPVRQRLPFWLASAKQVCYLPRGQSPNGSGAVQVWRLNISETGMIELPRELLELAGYWERDELRLCVGFIRGNGVATNAEGNAIVIQVVPHGLTRKEIDRAARQTARQIDQDRKHGRLVLLNATAAKAALRKKLVRAWRRRRSRIRLNPPGKPKLTIRELIRGKEAKAEKQFQARAKRGNPKRALEVLRKVRQ